MHLPEKTQLPSETIFHDFWRSDQDGYLSPKKSNKSFLNKRRVHKAIELFLKHIPAPSKDVQIADFACGTGNFGLELLERGYQVDFLDNEENFFKYMEVKNTTSSKLNCIKCDLSSFTPEKKYHGVYLGEAIEHMAHPEEVLKKLRESLLPGGVLCLTTPNGDYENCYEPSWSEVKDQVERNEKLANTMGNHVCEFRKKELSELVKESGFGLHEHKLVNSSQISRKSLLRRVLPYSLLYKLDEMWSKKKNAAGQDYGRIQIIVAQRFH